MTLYIALLRAVNVGGHGKIGMAALRSLLADLGFGNPPSLLQTGNLIFDSTERTRAELERLLADATAERLGLHTNVMVRTRNELARAVARNPFPDEASRDPGHLVLMFLKRAPEADAVLALRAAITGREQLHADGDHLYVTYPDGIGRSRLTSGLIESKLGTRGTSRNWNTVLKLAAQTQS